MNHSNPFSPHRDVLEASIPVDDDAAKQRLLEELKNRAKAAVAAGCWPDASALYRKGLECNGSDSAQAAILNANLSLCQGKMNMWKDAEESARKATQEDSSYVKGYWRLGQALGNLRKYDDAVQALEAALKLDPGNKALQKEYDKCLIKAKEAPPEEEMTKKVVEKVVTTTVRSNGERTVETTENQKISDTMEVDEDEDKSLFTKSENVRGYKIVNGKKTSYFHNELSEEAKQLIGDIAPKKLEESDALSNSNKTAANGTSVWNQAGTWEEKDVTQWAISALEEQLQGASYTLPASSPAPLATVTTTKTRVTGHASVATVRGKKRYIYELCVELDWKFEHLDNDVEATGSISFPDVDGTCAVGEGYEDTAFIIKDASTDAIRPILTNFVHKQGWRNKVHDAIDSWVQLFKETH